MKKIIVILLVVYCGVQISTQQFQGYLPSESEHRNNFFNQRLCPVNHDVTYDYLSSQYNFALKLAKPTGVRSYFNFLFSPISIWIMLAAIAEGADSVTQQKLFQLLQLPNDPCIRQAYYQLATSRLYASHDVNIKNTRLLLIDDGATLSPTWYDLVTRNDLLEVVKAPIRYNPIATAEDIRTIMSASLPRLNLEGNSVLMNTMDYNGLWTTAFADAVIERAPFYNLQGEVIGAVDIMKVQRRVRMGYAKSLQAKILELPFGTDGRYRMLFAIIVGDSDISGVVGNIETNKVFEALSSLQSSQVPIDVALPRTVINTELDVRAILEDLGVNDLWTDPSATGYISDPPALPASFVQRATLVLNNTGLYTPSEPASFDTRTGLDPILGRDFIADRPFFFGLFDAETYTTLLGGAFTQPTYKYEYIIY